MQVTQHALYIRRREAEFFFWFFFQNFVSSQFLKMLSKKKLIDKRSMVFASILVSLIFSLEYFQSWMFQYFPWRNFWRVQKISIWNLTYFIDLALPYLEKKCCFFGSSREKDSNKEIANKMIFKKTRLFLSYVSSNL